MIIECKFNWNSWKWKELFFICVHNISKWKASDIHEIMNEENSLLSTTIIAQEIYHTDVPYIHAYIHWHRTESQSFNGVKKNKVKVNKIFYRIFINNIKLCIKKSEVPRDGWNNSIIVRWEIEFQKKNNWFIIHVLFISCPFMQTSSSSFFLSLTTYNFLLLLIQWWLYAHWIVIFYRWIGWFFSVQL